MGKINFINKHCIKVKITGFKITNSIPYWENQIIDFIDNFLSYKVDSIEITKNNIKLFNKDASVGYSNFIFHTSLNGKDEILTFISTLNAASLYINKKGF